MLEPNQRVKVNLSGLTIQGVAFSQNVQEALGGCLANAPYDHGEKEMEKVLSEAARRVF